MGLKRIVLAVLLLVVSLAGGVATADHENGRISGTVTNQNGDGLADICVSVVDADDGYWWMGGGYTEADGTYIVEYLPGGSFKVRFDDCGDPVTYASEWYDDAPTFAAATPVAVTAGGETAGIDAVLATGGSIVGTVTDQDSGEPIAGICVSAHNEDLERWTSTAEDGGFNLGGLSTGAYRVHFGCDGPLAVPVPMGGATEERGDGLTVAWGPDPYVDEWYDDKDSYDAADPVAVVIGEETAGIDAALVLGGWISGSVVNEDGRPLEGICVDAYEASSFDWAGWGYAYDGSYTIPGLRAGTYKVQFYDCDYGIYASEWFDDQRSFRSADPVAVALGNETPWVDAVLAKRPVPDVAVTRVRIEPVPLTTDLGPLVGAGYLRDVHVEVANLGTGETEESWLEVWVRMGSSSSRLIGAVDVSGLAPGATKTYTMRWNGMGSAGDAWVTAVACEWYWQGDSRNNWLSVNGHVLVGGTGYGVDLTRSRDGFRGPCSEYRVTH